MFFTFALLNLLGVNAHGRLTVPATRNPTGYENDPVSGGNTGNDFVCRNALTSPAHTIAAGSQLTFKWDFGALHVGSCAVYISYDYAKGNSEMKFFKIANLFDCQAKNLQNVVINLPDWLPGGQAVVRWDWYALHVFPTVEYYAQCADVIITPTANAVALSTLTTYSIISPALYPDDGNSGVGFWYPYGSDAQWMTGPPCANGYGGNDCALTAQGTRGYIDVGDNTAPVQSPTNPPVSTPVQSPTNPPYSSPVQSPTAISGSGCQVHTVGNGDSLSAIASQFNAAGKAVTWEDICDFNMLSDCDNVSIGAVLAIPCQGCGAFELVSEVRRVYGVGVEVVVKNRCVDDENMVGKGALDASADPLVGGRDGTGTSGGVGSETDVMTFALLAMIGLMTFVTLGLTVYVCRRQKSLELKRFSNRSDFLPNLPTAPTAASGHRKPPPPAPHKQEGAWRI